MFDGQTFSNIFVTTNSVITFGRPDGTYWDYPQTPSISLYSMDWVVYPFARADERLVIRSSDGGFQVDISARPIWQQNATEPTNIVITAAILSDGTVAMAYSVDGPTYDGQTRTGVRLNDGSVVDFETYGIEQITESPSLSPVATTESPFVPEPTESPTVSPEPTESPSVSPETESSSVSPETESQTVSPDISESPTVSPEVQDPNRIVLIVNEGNVMSYVAPEGYKIDRIESASYGADGGCHAVDSQIIVESAVTNDSFTISADNSVFGDPCGGTYKRLEVVVIIEPLPDNESTESQTVSPVTESPSVSPETESSTASSESDTVSSPAVPSPEPSPEPVQPPILPQPVVPSPEPSPEPPTVLPTPEPTPTPEPEPTVTPTPEPEPTPEPTPTVEPTPEPTVVPEPGPTQTTKPEPQPTKEPTPEPTPSKEPESIVPEPKPEKEPTPTQEPVKVEIAEPITAENIEALVEELTTVAPQDLTTEQQTLIVAAALQVFENAEQGSAEYEAALDALLVVAQADDIVLDEELAAIPLIGNVAGAAVEVFNALGNAGADMSPEVRKQSEQVVVAAVIVGQVAMTATAAAASSAAAAAARRP